MRSVVVFAIISFFSLDAEAQTPNPCEDKEFLRLKLLPKASLAESERQYVERFNEACNEIKNKTNLKEPKQTLHLSVPKADIVLDSLEYKQSDDVEDLATARNLGILGAIGAVLIGIGIAIGNVTSSPF